MNSKEWGTDYSTDYQDLLPGWFCKYRVMDITIATGGVSHSPLEDIKKKVG